LTRWGDMKTRRLAICAAAAAVLAPVVAAGCSAKSTPHDLRAIKHIIVIMQENRSFDNYFGTYPGADGIAMKDGQPTACLPDANGGTCIRLFHDQFDVNAGGPHAHGNAVDDVNGGKMDGFLRQAQRALQACKAAFNPACETGNASEVLGYHTGADIPNYWKYAHDFVLQDRMFQPDESWTLPAHLFTVSQWSAYCTERDNPASCKNSIGLYPPFPPDLAATPPASPPPLPIYAWTDITYLLHKHNVSWRYYVVAGAQADCDDPAEVACASPNQDANTPGLLNPLPAFDTVRADHQLGNIQSVQGFYKAAKDGSLPSVSWVVPSRELSEHPPERVSDGQAYVTSLINAVMKGPDWKSTAIFLTWDDWGGLYDHVQPPLVDINGYGLRVPGLLISPYAKRGFIDHQTLSFDAYDKLIEDRFLGGQRLDPQTDGRPDPRTDVREEAPELGDLLREFDFNQKPRPPELLPLYPPSDLIAPAGAKGHAELPIPKG
jgi:phospholipase C